MTGSQNEFESVILVAIRQKIGVAHRIVVVTHVRPDGDAVGSLLGLGLALQAAGKDVQMVLPDGVPSNLCHLEGSERIKLKTEGPVDLTIVLDVSDLPRLGRALDGYGTPDVCIDHHFTNEKFARLNLVDGDAVATAEIIARILPDLGLNITKPVANALLTGLITDTIGFRTPNVTPSTMRMVADLIDAGGELSVMYYPALDLRTFEGARYWGAGLSRMQKQDGLVWTYLSLDDRKRAGYVGNDDADLINVLSAIEGTDIAMILVEQSPTRVKISWRICGQSVRGIDVSGIANKFGGGGHKAAAGAEIDGTLIEVLTKVLGTTKEYLAYNVNPSA